MARGARPEPAGFDHKLFDRRIVELGLRSVDAKKKGLHWGYVTRLREGGRTPGARKLPDLARFVSLAPCELYPIPEDEVTVAHLRHFVGLTVEDAVAALGWPYGFYRSFEQGAPLAKDQSESKIWRRAAKVFQVPERRVRMAWGNTNRRRLTVLADSGAVTS